MVRDFVFIGLLSLVVGATIGWAFTYTYLMKQRRRQDYFSEFYDLRKYVSEITSTRNQRWSKKYIIHRGKQVLTRVGRR